MARAPRLKVYGTNAGFYDAIVAVPNQRAALEAWGTRTNLFAAGRAASVEDEAIRAEALARPGEVVMRPRGPEVAALDETSREPARKASTPRKPRRRPARSA